MPHYYHIPPPLCSLIVQIFVFFQKMMPESLGPTKPNPGKPLQIYYIDYVHPSTTKAIELNLRGLCVAK